VFLLYCTVPVPLARKDEARVLLLAVSSQVMSCKHWLYVLILLLLPYYFININ